MRPESSMVYGAPHRGTGRRSPMQYYSGADTLAWTRVGQTCWQREDGVKVVQHQSYLSWAIADQRVCAHAGWFHSKFSAMDAADIVLPDQRVSGDGMEAQDQAVVVTVGEQRLARELFGPEVHIITPGQMIAGHRFKQVVFTDAARRQIDGDPRGAEWRENLMRDAAVSG